MEPSEVKKGFYKINIHLGSGDTGREVLTFLNTQAETLNMFNARSQPNVSGYTILLIKKEMRRLKAKQTRRVRIARQKNEIPNTPAPN